MRRWRIDAATGTTREMWAHGDCSHAWQCTPLIQLSTRVLRVTPAAPGWDAARIAPTPCDFAWARGTVPTPRGDVRVDWAVEAPGWRCAIEVPSGIDATQAVPAFRLADPMVPFDGAPAWRIDAPVGGIAYRDGDRIALRLGAGRHRVVAAGDWSSRR